MRFKDGNDPDIDKAAKALAKTVSSLFDNKRNLLSVISFNPNVKGREILEVLSKFSIERGSRDGQLHTHGVLKILHNSKLQLAYTKIRHFVYTKLSELLEEVGLEQYAPKDAKGIHVHVKFLENVANALKDQKAIEEYILKNSLQLEGSEVSQKNKRKAEETQDLPPSPIFVNKWKRSRVEERPMLSDQESEPDEPENQQIDEEESEFEKGNLTRLEPLDWSKLM